MVVPRGERPAETQDLPPPPPPLAELYCPFPHRENPGAAAAQERSLEWALEHGLVAEGPGLERLVRARFGELEAGAFPEAPLEVLKLATIWVTLFCALDDYVESSRLGVLGLSRYLSEALTALRGSTMSPADPLIGGFGDVGREVKSLFGAEVAAEFGRELEDLFAAFVWEEINRQNAAHPDYAGYRILRGTTVGLRPHFLLAEAVGPATRASERDGVNLRELERITCLAVGWANDIYTYEKELSAGEVHNIVAVMMRREHLPLDVALERARALHDEEVCSFLRLQARIETSPDANDATAYRLANLRHWIGGHLHWARRNGRYRPHPVAA